MLKQHLKISKTKVGGGSAQNIRIVFLLLSLSFFLGELISCSVLPGHCYYFFLDNLLKLVSKIRKLYHYSSVHYMIKLIIMNVSISVLSSQTLILLLVSHLTAVLRPGLLLCPFTSHGSVINN